MRYYSDTLMKLFDTESALVKAEHDAKVKDEEKAKAAAAKKAERARRAKEVEAAIKAADAASDKAQKLTRDFIKDYGSYHMSYTTETPIKKTTSIDSFFDVLSSFLE